VRSHAVLNPVPVVFLLVATAVVGAQNLASILADDRGSDFPVPLAATVVATGIPGAGAIAQIDKGEFTKIATLRDPTHERYPLANVFRAQCTA